VLCAVAAAGQAGWTAAAAIPAVQPEAARQAPNVLPGMAWALVAGLLVWALVAGWRRVSERAGPGWTLRQAGDEGLIRAMMEHSSQLCGLLSCDGRMLRMNHVGALWMGPEASTALSRLALWEHPIWSAEPGQAQLLRDAVQAAARGKVGRLGALLLGGPGGTRQV
jgi:hypothetical protein